MGKIPIAIADDHKLFLHSFAEFINNHSDCQVMVLATNGTQLLDALKSTEIALLLTDINMPGKSGLELIPEVKKIYPVMKIVAVSQYDEVRLIKHAEALGADGYFIKSNEPDELLLILDQVLKGGTAFSHKASPPQTPVEDYNHPLLFPYQFTRREKEILFLIRQNFSNREIASRLFISEFTVETHNKNICQKLGTSDRKQVYHFAQKLA